MAKSAKKRCDRKFASTIDLYEDRAVACSLKLKPCTTARDKFRTIVITTSSAISCKEYTRATNKLRYNNTLCTVNDKCTAVSHPWIITKVNLLLFYFTSYFVCQLNVYVKRRIKSKVIFLCLDFCNFWILERIFLESKFKLLACVILDRI